MNRDRPAPGVRRLAAAAFALLLAGCLAPGAPEAGTAGPGLACPPGGRVVPGGACIGVLGSATERLEEPDLALDPLRPGVAALGANAVSVGAGPPAVGTALFVTRDDGATWERVLLPPIPGYLHFGDPTVAFAPDGTLMLGELALELPSGPAAVVVLRSPDLGATWAWDIVQRGGDRPWVSVVGTTPFVTWQDRAPSTSVAWLEGEDWVRAGRVEGCNLQTQVAGAAVPVFACLQKEGDRYWTSVRALDLPARRSHEAARLPSPVGTLYLEGGSELLLAVQRPASVDVHRSVDGGASWTHAADLRRGVRADDGWNWTWLAAFHADGSGGLHGVLVGGTGSSCFRGDCPDADVRRELVLVSGNGTGPAHERRLTSADPAHRRVEQGSALPLTLADDFAAIATAGDEGLVAWGHAGRVEWTRLLLNG
jgi:hypothetical protein